MRLVKLLRRDIRYGILGQMIKLLPVVIVVVFMFLKWDMYLDYLEQHGNMIRERSFMDIVLFMFEGMQVYSFDPKSFFSPPLLWIVFNIIILYFTAYYPCRDCGYYGKTIFIAGKTRVQWWFSKMIWCALSVVVCYATTFISILAGTIIKGYKLSLNIDTDFLISQYGNGVRYLNKIDIIVVIFVLPIIISITMCELQMLLGFIVTPVISFALMCGLFVVSAFYTVWWLLPNYTMWRRSAYYDYKGLLPSSGLILSGYVLILVMFLGSNLIKKRDIL